MRFRLMLVGLSVDTNSVFSSSLDAELAAELDAELDAEEAADCIEDIVSLYDIILQNILKEDTIDARLGILRYFIIVSVM